MNGVLTWMVRWRVAVCAVTLVTAAGLQAVADLPLPVEFVLLLVLPFGLILWSVLLARSWHPAVLVARPRRHALEAGPEPRIILGAVGYTLIGSRTLASALRDLAAGEDLWFSAIFATFWLLAVVLFWAAALGRFGVRLGPDGITDRHVLGSVFVPWDVLDGPVAAFAFDPQQVTLAVDPEQAGRIRKRGLVLGNGTTLSASGVDAELLARAIHEYRNRPGARRALGTDQELARFLAIPQIAELTGQR